MKAVDVVEDERRENDDDDEKEVHDALIRA